MIQNEIRTNETYGVHPVFGGGFKIVARNPKDLFPTNREDNSKINVLLYLDKHALDEDYNSGRHLAYALSTISHIAVGITTHANIDHAHEANAVLTRLTLPEDHEFHVALNEYDDGNRAIFTASKQRKKFTGKTIEHVVKTIRDEAQALF